MRAPLPFIAFVFSFLFLVSAGRADEFPTDFAPTLSFTERYSERKVSDGDGDYTVAYSSNLTLKGKVSMKDVDLTAFDSGTDFSISAGSLELSCYLGDDPDYDQGDMAATIILIGYDPDTWEELEVGSLQLTWTAKTLNYTLTITNDASDYQLQAYDLGTGGVDYDDYFDAPIVNVNFGENTLSDRTLYITGTVVYRDDDYVGSLATVSIKGEIDSGAPTGVAITSPVGKGTTYGSPFLITGTAQDEYGLDQVLVQLNGGEFVPAQIVDDMHWQLSSADFVNGKNTLVAKAVDLEGNSKATKALVFTFSNASSVSVLADGTVPGQVKSALFPLLKYAPPAASPTQMGTGKAGDKLTVTAIPGAGAIFGGWTSNKPVAVPANAAEKLTFTLVSDLVLTAHFVPNPFLSIQGVYNGLIDTADHSSRGLVSVAVSSKGAFSGTVRLDGAVFPVKGVFSAGLHYEGTLKKRAVSYPITLDLAPSGPDGAGHISGTITRPNLPSATVSADQAAYAKITNEVQLADRGAYNTLLPPSGGNLDPMYPVGIGSGRVTLSKTGAARLVGKLGDGTTISVGGVISKTQEWPLYASLYKGKGFITGSVAFDRSQPLTDMSGVLTWKSPGAAKRFVGGFRGDSQLLSVKYAKPSSGERAFLLDTAGVGTWAIDAPASASPARQAIGTDLGVTLSTANKFAFTDSPLKPKTTVTLATGAFKGSFLDPETHKAVPFSGFILSSKAERIKVDAAGGFFLRGDGSGSVQIIPQSIE